MSRLALLVVSIIVMLPAAAEAASLSTRSCQGTACVTRIVELPGPELERSVASDGACPGERTCDRFAVFPERWPRGADGRVTIPFLVSTFDHPYVSSEHLRAAYARTAVAWEAADPALDFVDAGTTDEPVTTASTGDGRNTIGFGIIPFPGAAAAAMVLARDGVIVEVDIALQATSGFAAAPCEQADGSCAGAGGFDLLPNVTFTSVESVLTHELGHAIGLDHAPGEGAERLTMFSVAQSQEDRRISQTLGLGDVLGAREVIPCGECGGPPRVLVP